MMDDCKLPATDWDVVVSGTGVKPSLLAAALSRAGKKVLQLDANDFYGGNETAFAIDELEAWAAAVAKSSAATPGSNSSGSFSAFSHTSTERRTTIGRPRAYTLTLAPHVVYWDSDLLRLLRNADMAAAFTWQALGSFWVWLSDSAVAQRPAVTGGGGGLGGVLAEAGAKAARVGGTIRRKGGGWNKGRKHESLQLDRDLFGDGEDGGGGGDGGEGQGPGQGQGARRGERRGEQRADTGQTQLPRAETAAGFSALRRLGDLREVPCTFEDVAWSPDLLDRDRGYLGSFLRFVSNCTDPDNAKDCRLLHGTSAPGR